MKKTLFTILSILSLFASAQDFKVVKNEKLSLTGYEDGLRTIWFSSDNSVLFGDFNHLIKWNIQSGKIIQSIPLPGYHTNQTCIAPDQSLWVQGNSNYNDPKKKDITDMHANLNTYGFAYDQLTSTRLNEFNINSAEFIPGRDYQILAIETDRKTYINSLNIYSLADHKNLVTVATAKSDSDIMSCLDVTKDGKHAVVGYAGKNSRVEIYDLINVKLLRTITTVSEISKIRVENGTIAAAGSSKIHIIDLKSKELVKTLDTEAQTFALALSPNGKTVAVGGRIGGAEIIDIASESRDQFYTGQCQSLAFDSKGNMLAVGVFKTLHSPEIPSAFIFFNENKKEEVELSEHQDSNSTKDDWISYSSAEPKFTVSLPLAPKINKSVNKNGVEQIGLKSVSNSEGVLVNISTIEVKEKKIDDFISKTNTNFLTKMEQNLDEINISEVVLKKGKGQDFTFIKNGIRYECRTIYNDGQLYQLIYFESDKLDSGNATKLFNSFAL